MSTAQPEKARTTRLPDRRFLFLSDALTWMLGLFLAVTARYGGVLSEVNWFIYALAVVAAVALQLGFGLWFNLYRRGGKLRTGSYEDALSLILTAGSAGGIIWLVSLIFGGIWGISRSSMAIATLITLLLMLSVRFLVRSAISRSRRPGPQSEAVLIIGGGYIGTNLVRWTMSDPASSYCPVGVMDDDPDLLGRKIHGVPVIGTTGTQDIELAAQTTGATTLIVAIGNAEPSLLRRMSNVGEKAGLQVKVMPSIDDVVKRGVHGNDLRDLSIEDLLGRDPVETDVSEIASYLTGKRVLVTGAGGSIGSQLCSEIAKYCPAELMMLDRDETGLQQVLMNVAGNGLLDTDDIILADIRDECQLKEIFLHRRPEVVFHAAALKHLPVLERYPAEAWKTNVIGTFNVLSAAHAANVETFINISTDKAANPTSALGHSKRWAEMITSWFGQETCATYLSVRFGNVIGSRGSMLPTFMRLIEEGKPLTVTHPDVTRYFMTIPEACQLVLQAGGIGSSGEVLILDMGEPVSILNIAERMVAMSGKDIDIIFTGLREGEKMHEELVGNGESEDRPLHPLISHARAPELSPDDLCPEKFLSCLGNQKVAGRSSESETVA